MAVNSVLAPYPSFFDAAGDPLENGFIYIGEAGFEARSTPKASFFDVAQTIPTGTASGAAIRTKAGFPVNTSNAPAMFYADGDFSISVCDRNGVLLYSALNMTLALNVGAAVGSVLWADGNLGAVGGGFANEPSTGFVRPSAGVMQSVVNGVLVSQQTATGTVFSQPVSGPGFVSGVAAALDADLTQIAGLARTRGDLIRGGAAAWERLALGANRSVIGSNGTDIVALPAGGDLFYRAEGTLAGANVTTAQDIFALDVTLEANTVYEYEIFFSMSKSAGITSHTISVGYGGTATINNIQRNLLSASVVNPATTTGATDANGYTLSAAQRLVTPAITTAAINFWYREIGTVSISAGGTFIPQYQLSAAPGGAYTANLGSYFKLRRLGASGADVTSGPWA